MITLDPLIYDRYPDCRFAWMIAENIGHGTDRPTLDRLKEEGLRQIKLRHTGYERSSFIKTEPVCHYVSYYRSFGKTYPVLQQLESIVLKNKGLPAIGASIEAMFLAEVHNLLLTAGHDRSRLQGELRVGIARGTESYRGFAGKELLLTAGDLYLTDECGIMSSILGGPDHRTKITANTTDVLYFAYGACGVTKEQLHRHLAMIADCLKAAVPETVTGPVMLAADH